MWMAVEVGCRKQVYTHGNKLKKVSFRTLPKKDDAIYKRPHGLYEIKNTIYKHTSKKTFLIYDGWLSTEAAAERLGYMRAPPGNHSIAWRDSRTGFHTNGVESENQRLKAKMRRRYGQLWAEEGDVYEYVFYTNKGTTMWDVMNSIPLTHDGAFPVVLIK